MKKWIPWIVAGVLGAWALGSLRVPADKQWAINEFGRLPVMFGGRVQPFDSLARNSLLQIREKARANFEPWKNWWEKPKLISATEWGLMVMMKPAEADTWPVFRIDNPDVKSLLALPGEPNLQQHIDGKHFSWQQIEPKLAELRGEVARASEKQKSSQNAYDRALLQLWNSRTIYVRLKNALGPAAGGDLDAGLAEYQPKLEAGRRAWMAQMERKEFDEAALRWTFEQMDAPIMIPAAPPEGGKRTDGWKRVADVFIRGDTATPPQPVVAYAQMAKAFRAGDSSAFNAAVDSYRSWLNGDFGDAARHAGRELRFNFAEPFYKALLLYVFGFLFALAYWVMPRHDWLRQTALACAVVALLVHSGGLITRMALQGRPPVTNLYSSAVFIGWGACVLGLILEKFWRNSIGIVVSAVIGFGTLMIAHHLNLRDGDTMVMMEAVLDTNFWLATHVVVVTLGYASTFVAGFLAIAYVVRGVFSKAITPELGRSFSKMVFGIICFATLFSFVGTVLGGIWADQSWGRFWGWDPKENGAMIIVLWNALILHARMAGLVRERGLMNMAIVGNIVTSWSWFGVNMLEVGLHSYGFMGAAFYWLIGFVASQLLLIGLGLLPTRYWQSFRQAVPAPKPPSPPARDPELKPA